MVALVQPDNRIEDEQPSRRIIHGDCLEVMKGMASNSVDALCCDPPAGISFMNLAFDSDKGGRNQWIAWLTEVMQEALRIVRPGGHAFVWALPRTSHWTATALEDAGWEIRDEISHHYGTSTLANNFLASLDTEQRNALEMLLSSQSPNVYQHLFGSGFPKSHNISIAIDKHLNAEREVIGNGKAGRTALSDASGKVSGYRPNTYRAEDGTYNITSPTTDAAKQYDGFGTNLKPSHETWFKVHKPLTTVPNYEIITQTTNILEALLWSLSPVKLVESPLPLNSQEQHEATSSSVRWIANVWNMLKSPALSDLMDTFNSQAEAETYLSIAWLWNSILDALYSNTNKYTTSITTDLTTDLKTLNSWTSAIMPESIADLVQSGVWAYATTAENNSTEAFLSWSHIPTLSAQEHVGMPIMKIVVNTLVKSAELLSLPILPNIVCSVRTPVITNGEQNTAQLTPYPTTSTNRPSHENWLLARKPLSEKSIAENVLRWNGCGALNIDASRIGTTPEPVEWCDCEDEDE